jgi:hypothetical protein
VKIRFDFIKWLKWPPRTSAKAAGLTDHVQTLKEVFSMVVLSCDQKQDATG